MFTWCLLETLRLFLAIMKVKMAPETLVCKCVQKKETVILGDKLMWTGFHQSVHSPHIKFQSYYTYLNMYITVDNCCKK